MVEEHRSNHHVRHVRVLDACVHFRSPSHHPPVAAGHATNSKPCSNCELNEKMRQRIEDTLQGFAYHYMVPKKSMGQSYKKNENSPIWQLGSIPSPAGDAMERPETLMFQDYARDATQRYSRWRPCNGLFHVPPTTAETAWHPLPVVGLNGWCSGLKRGGLVLESSWHRFRLQLARA